MQRKENTRWTSLFADNNKNLSLLFCFHVCARLSLLFAILFSLHCDELSCPLSFVFSFFFEIYSWKDKTTAITGLFFFFSALTNHRLPECLVSSLLAAKKIQTVSLLYIGLPGIPLLHFCVKLFRLAFLLHVRIIHFQLFRNQIIDCLTPFCVYQTPLMAWVFTAF
jgi:hypothetical protein